MQRFSTPIFIISIIFGGLAKSQNESSIDQALSANYAPITVECPTNIQWVRPANGLSKEEVEWVSKRKVVVFDALHDYLDRLTLEDFDLHEFAHRIKESNYQNVPTLAMAISGGGYRSGYTGTGIMRAMDSRLPAANLEKIGGLLQSLTYLTGQSGGGFPVGSFLTHNFPTTDELVQLWISQLDAFNAVPDNSTAAGSFASMFIDIGQKYAAGFNVSTSDFLGRDFAYEFLPGVRGGLGVTWSGIRSQSKFISHEMPLGMVQATALEADDPRYYGYQVPSSDSPFYEFTPFEFGSWDSRIAAFTPMEWTGTQISDGTPVNSSACVRGFDRASFVMGTAASAFNFWEVEDISNGTLVPFSKRSLSQSSASKTAKLARRDTGPNGEILFPAVQLAEIAFAFKEFFNLTTPFIAFPSWPNPFLTSNTSSSSTSQGESITFVDSSESNQSIPVWPLIQPARNTSFIIAYEDGPDALPYGWIAGANLHNSYLAANTSGLPFPVIPPVNTLQNKNYTLKPTLFGCDINLTTTKSSDSPIVLYIANAPYSAYTNYTWTGQAGAFDATQFNEIFVNSFNQLTQGNGTLESDWTTCLGCAVIDRTLDKIGMQRTNQCQECLQKYCWDGTYDQRTPAILDPSLATNPGLGYLEWNATSAL
ncbi:FabD/lysophospholipase-like protein [Hyaloscypha variabilis F]|uniref:Lysophospholipase n=1 Tax=Hyaloscypha variabilis (strain UAMH 11265 / GT02V1 / F) TaxID=1149755 RepID=A0A2J6SBG3_HYAVF|nr:FabD/lysophospholipase-like protein [Hyaloscypha variabilis F]